MLYQCIFSTSNVTRKIENIFSNKSSGWAISFTSYLPSPGGSLVREGVSDLGKVTWQVASTISLPTYKFPVHFSVDWTITHLGREGMRMMDGQAKADTKCHAGGGSLLQRWLVGSGRSPWKICHSESPSTRKQSWKPSVPLLLQSVLYQTFISWQLLAGHP